MKSKRVFLVVISVFVLYTCVSGQGAKFSISIRLDNDYAFDYRNLSVFTLYRRTDNDVWRTWKRYGVDANGDLNEIFPKRGFLRLEIRSTDPTIRRFQMNSDKYDFYSLEKGEKILVYREELNLGTVNDRVIRVVLTRGGAYSLCSDIVTAQRRVVFSRSDSSDEDGLNSYSFRQVDLAQVVIGGIDISTPWNFRYLDRKGAAISQEVVDFSNGFMVVGKCSERTL
jgi:hypothetical protein